MTMNEQALFRIPKARAKNVALRELSDPAKFLVDPAEAPFESPCEFVAEFFTKFASASAAYGDLQLRRGDVALVEIDGSTYVRVGYDADAVELLLDVKGQVYEWDGMVLDGPCAPSGWHHVIWICHLLYDLPLDALPTDP